MGEKKRKGVSESPAWKLDIRKKIVKKGKGGRSEARTKAGNTCPRWEK